MNNKTIGSYIERLAETNNYIMKELGDTCIDFKYKKVITQLQNTSVFSPVAYGGSKLTKYNFKRAILRCFFFFSNIGRQWIYQTCNEFGFFQTSQAFNQIFGDEFPLDFFVNQCIHIFGAPLVYINKNYLNLLNLLLAFSIYINNIDSIIVQ